MMTKIHIFALLIDGLVSKYLLLFSTYLAGLEHILADFLPAFINVLALSVKLSPILPCSIRQRRRSCNCCRALDATTCTAALVTRF